MSCLACLLTFNILSTCTRCRRTDDNDDNGKIMRKQKVWILICWVSAVGVVAFVALFRCSSMQTHWCSYCCSTPLCSVPIRCAPAKNVFSLRLMRTITIAMKRKKLSCYFQVLGKASLYVKPFSLSFHFCPFYSPIINGIAICLMHNKHHKMMCMGKRL